MTAAEPVPTGEPEETLSGRFVVLALTSAVIITVVLCFALPAIAGQVSQVTTPKGAITSGRVSLQPQPGWDLLESSDPDQSAEPTLAKEGVVLGLASVPADQGGDPRTYLDLMLAEFGDSFVADYEPVPFRTPTGDQGLAVTATGTNQSGMFAVVVARDQTVVALVPVIGDPVATSALIPEISDMITTIRIRRAAP